jgi:hypothetical protein
MSNCFGFGELIGAGVVLIGNIVGFNVFSFFGPFAYSGPLLFLA